MNVVRNCFNIKLFFWTCVCVGIDLNFFLYYLFFNSYYYFTKTCRYTMVFRCISNYSYDFDKMLEINTFKYSDYIYLGPIIGKIRNIAAACVYKFDLLYYEDC